MRGWFDNNPLARAVHVLLFGVGGVRCCHGGWKEIVAPGKSNDSWRVGTLCVLVFEMTAPGDDCCEKENLTFSQCVAHK